MGMWLAYYEAYQDKAAEEKAHLEIKKTNARILMIAGGADEAWPEIIPHDSACRHDVYFGKHKKECMAAFEQSEKEIINWLR